MRASEFTKRIKSEDYDPNGPPPGPEFKPTMPKGTVKVDVSDVYDWYKLGQHVSNLKGLGKHDFGKGPPSTIMAFGDEDTEHKYIGDLEKTGLSTTDIDPVDPNQPKGMKRQKVDPTYNVNEQDAAPGFDKEAEAWRDWQLKMLPRKMDMLSKLVNGWVPSEEDHITAIEAGYDAMRETGDVKDAAKAIADTLKEIQRRQGVSEERKKKRKRKKYRTPRSITTGWWGGYYGDNSSGGEGGGGE